MKHENFVSETTLTRAFNKASFYGLIAVLLRHTFSITKDLRFSFSASPYDGKNEKVTVRSPST